MRPRPTLPLLLLILLLGGCLRLIGLRQVPPGFFRDEADKGYGAYSLLETGRDVEGRLWPLQIRSLNVYTSPIYQWAAIPFIRIGGLDETAVRLPAAVMGTLAILAIFLVGRELLGDAGGLIGAFLIVVSPWDVLLTRWANQGSFLPVFVCLAVYAYLRYSTLTSTGREAGTPLPKGGRGDIWALLSGILFFLALFTYAPARVFVPLFLVILTAVSIRSFGRTRCAVALPVWIAFLALAVPFALYLAAGWGETARRFEAVSIFSGPGGLPAAAGRFVTGFLKHLSPEFLFLTGDANLRHSVPGWGQMYHIEAFTVLLGAAVAVLRRKPRDLVLLGWALAAFVPPALTREGVPHALRSIAAVPALVLISASGFLFLWDVTADLRQRTPWGLLPVAGIALVLFAEVFGFTTDLFLRYPNESYPYWQYGYRDAVRAVMAHQKPGDTVSVSAISEYPEVFFLFYERIPPGIYQEEEVVDRVVVLEQPVDGRSVAGLVPGLALLRPGETAPGPLLATVRAPDSRPVWDLYRVPHAHP